MWTLIVYVIISTAHQISSLDMYPEAKQYPMLMPNVQPKKNNTYLCMAFKMSRYETEYIVAIDSNANENFVHHILIFGCKVPGVYARDAPRVIWECDEMHQEPDPSSPWKKGPPCVKGIAPIYDWAMGATKTFLPKGVGFKVGKGTDFPFIVMEVHYSDVSSFINGDRDQSGIILSMLPGNSKMINKRASIVVMGSLGTIAANSTEHFETECKIDQNIFMHPFAFQPHTHKLGTLVSGWLIQDGQWKLLGKKDPQKPQLFYPIEDQSLVIRPNDTLAARCTYHNYLPYPVSVGSTKDDEMCNFYLMYWVDGDETFHQVSCWSDGAPNYYWSKDPLIGQVPELVDQQASTLD